MVVKDDGTLRMCVDYRSLNSKTVSDPYQMPRVEEVLESLSEAEYISKIDLNKGYYQIPIKLDDQLKTAFCSSWGKFMFIRIPFGLKNAPAMFYRVLHHHKSFTQIYIDDVAVYSTSWEEHCIHIDKVLQP